MSRVCGSLVWSIRHTASGSHHTVRTSFRFRIGRLSARRGSMSPSWLWHNGSVGTRYGEDLVNFFSVFGRGVRVGRRSATGNRVGGVEPSRGFESHPLRFFFYSQVERDNLKVKEVRCQGYLGPVCTATGPAQGLVHRSCGRITHAGQYMRMGVQCDRDDDPNPQKPELPPDVPFTSGGSSGRTITCSSRRILYTWWRSSGTGSSNSWGTIPRRTPPLLGCPYLTQRH